MPTSASYPPKFSRNYRPPRSAELKFHYRFLEGEVFFVTPMGWKGVSGFGKSVKNHPGCVVIQQEKPRKPVVMVPGTTQPRGNESNYFPQCPFWQVGNNRRSQRNSAFLYLYATPVPRHELVSFFGVLADRDIDGLLKAIWDKLGPNWRERHG